MVVINENHNKIKEIPLIRNIRKTVPFEKSILFFNTDDWNRVKEYIKVDYATFQLTVINQEKLETTLFPQGIKDMFYVSNLLKIMDKKGYTFYLNPETLKNYGTAENEYALIQQNPEIKTLQNAQETITEYYITQAGYTLYQMQQNHTGTQRNKACKKSNEVKEQKIIVGFFTEKELGEQKKQKEAEIQENCTKTDFLEGRFIGASVQHNVILVLSFQTTDHNNAIIHCFDKNLKPVWEKNNTALHINIKSVKNMSAAISENYIFLSSKNTVIVIDKQNGSVLKQVKI